MEINKSVSNPMLVGAMQLIKADGKEPNPSHQAMFMEELDKAELLAPAEILAEVDEGGNKLINEKAKVRFPVLTAPDGKRFFVLFSDSATVESAKKKDDPNGVMKMYTQDNVALRFSQMAGMLLAKNPDGSDNGIFGIIINPFLENIVIPKTSVEKAHQMKTKE